MDVSDVFRSPSEPLREVRLDQGDYVAGEVYSLLFLDLDGCRCRRLLVFGEITDDLSAYPEVAAEMFSSRQDDSGEWVVI